MEIFDERKQTTLKVNFSGKLAELLKQLEINPVTVIITKNNEVITEDTLLNDNDIIEILSVVSGG
jgi:sulfur carrier protein